MSLRYLEGAEVDYREDLMGGGFAIKNPNATSTCGCGHSFQAGEGGRGAAAAAATITDPAGSLGRSRRGARLEGRRGARLGYHERLREGTPYMEPSRLQSAEPESGAAQTAAHRSPRPSAW